MQLFTDGCARYNDAMARTIRFHLPIQKATLLRRYKRFLADVQLENGDKITVACANTGTMKSCSEPGRPILISDSLNDKRKYRHTWEAIRMGRTWVGVNTMNPNRAVSHWIQSGEIPELTGYAAQKREQKYGREGGGGRSRIDILLSEPVKRAAAPLVYVEVKNTSMRIGEHSAFPDAVTTRGQKHLRELIDEVSNGNRAVMFYFCGRADTRAFRPANEIDPEYARLFEKALKAGVEVLPYRVRHTPTGVKLEQRLPLA